MSYEEKGSWVVCLVMTGTFTAYVAVILGRADGIPLTEVSYRSLLLWSMGIAIGLSIVGRIVLEIVRPSESYKVDARDKDIGRFGEYVGGSVLTLGMLVPFVLALLTADHFWIANAMYATFAIAAIVGQAAKLVAYRRGLWSWANRQG